MIDNIDQPQLLGIPEPERTEYLRLFDLVKNKHNWRKPISIGIKLNPKDVPNMRQAIRLITGSRDIVITQSGYSENEYIISAEGHFNAASG